MRCDQTSSASAQRVERHHNEAHCMQNASACDRLETDYTRENATHGVLDD